jgi:hypothetical protein
MQEYNGKIAKSSIYNPDVGAGFRGVQRKGRSAPENIPVER